MEVVAIYDPSEDAELRSPAGGILGGSVGEAQLQAGPYRHRRFMAIAGEMRGSRAFHISVSLDSKYVGRSFLICTRVLKNSL